ncbi:uncharacterized protein LOC105193913 isoform X4 [Solenopsis invicta]|uniref:uncharacterized protein LOC105193913 isoform X4 n=1 Tax=Solenopsis invicta TaxID=13686 RepID=UPI000E33FFEF|nr:uncharacterized protein LOC105193913 isoform X4 [Solenopsis invicta]
MTMASNIVVEWLRSLHLGQYSESFIDNGYDDLEICKQIGDPDLDAIGVFNQKHRARLLQSVKTLREEGAASVYFTLEETVDNSCDNVSSKSSRTSSDRPPSDKETQRASPTASSSSGGQELTKFADEYEEGKAELVRIPRMQLRMLLQEKLRHDGIRLACQPYTTPEGERGYLEGLASRYADLFRTHYGDVLEPLEELRRRETNASTRMPNTQLTTSHSQPIYVPGKYSPSSCLSDKEEDEIYGFGYGVFSRQMLQHRQQKLALATQNTTTAVTPSGPQTTYQSCLSPRSAFFYEFPPNEQGQNTSKKKTTFSRLLRGLKTHRKEKQGQQAQSSPRHGRARMGVPQRVDTPDSVLQSGLGLGPDMGHTILRSMVDPRDYDRLRYLQMNGGQPNSFEETIHRLKVQEALRKKERFHKEHEEILRDIRQGLMQLGRDGRGQLPGDDTYMYDEDARCGGAGGLGPGPGGHWYDEPPYESDPEDFLMGASGGPVPTATIQNGRVCFTLNMKPENRGEGVISLRTAGDISLPRDRSRKGATSTMRGLIVPQGHNNPPTIIPLTHSRASRESGDYASSDVQEHIPVFVLNGYEDLELFRELEAADLDYLRIHQPEHRAKILTAVQLLHECLQSGSEGDLASSSEGDEVSRLVLTSGQTSGHCSPFNRRQFPRDSGCYDAHKNTTSRRTISPESTTTSSKLSRENNLDNATAVAKNTNSSTGATDGGLTDTKDDFHPNIPISSSVAGQKENQFEKSPLLRGGNVRYIAKRGNFGETVVIEDACEGAQKLSGMVKYMVGGSNDLGLEGTGNVTSLSQRGCLSEKSSDSGVSSSSISSAPPPRDKVLATASAASDSPTKNFGSFTRASPTSQSGKSHGNEGSYQ